MQMSRLQLIDLAEKVISGVLTVDEAEKIIDDYHKQQME